ncbi:RNA polymerase sigma factor [Streptomyces sp. NPDC058892]|uniref:RNA polymerase sigma factor n=1 Tax=unclassified Streptomyces TaxID=2593676 RepID=UPI0036C731E5
MTSESLPNRGLPAQKRRRLPERFFGKSTPLTIEEHLEDLARAQRVYRPSIERRLGQQHRGSQLAEDVWQNALIKIAERMKDGEPIDNVRAYMYRVCNTCALDELRRISRRAEDLFDDDPSALEEWEKNIRLHGTRLYYADIKPDLDSLLTPMEHQAIYLIKVMGFTSNMAAELMNVSSSSARKALRRARDKIRGHQPRIGQDA